jgi:hypothetical protein
VYLPSNAKETTYSATLFTFLGMKMKMARRVKLMMSTDCEEGETNDEYKVYDDEKEEYNSHN